MALSALPGGGVFGFETGDDGFDMGGDWSRGSDAARTGSWSLDFYFPYDYYWDYEDDQTSFASSFDLRACAPCATTLEYHLYGYAESGWDYLYSRCSGDGGGSWSDLDTGISGSYGWTAFQRTVPASCLTAASRIGFRFTSDGSITYEGYALDDLRLFPTTASQPTGHFDGVVTTTLWGWTCDPDEWSTELAVHLYFYRNGTGSPAFRATVADVFRQDLIDAYVCGGTGDHGFGFAFDQELIDWLGSGTHTVRAYALDVPAQCGYGGPEVLGSPIQFSL
jgi:hypothetical protein